MTKKKREPHRDHMGRFLSHRFVMSSEKLYFRNLESIEFDGDSSMEEFKSNDEDFLIQVAGGYDTLNAGKRTINDEGTFACMGILEVFDFDGGLNETIDGFHMFIRGLGWALPRGFAQELDDPIGAEDIYSRLIIGMVQGDKKVTGKHGEQDLFPPIFPFAPYLDLG